VDGNVAISVKRLILLTLMRIVSTPARAVRPPTTFQDVEADFAGTAFGSPPIPTVIAASPTTIAPAPASNEKSTSAPFDTEAA
jgi:hypothetical protein